MPDSITLFIRTEVVPQFINWLGQVENAPYQVVAQEPVTHGTPAQRAKTKLTVEAAHAALFFSLGFKWAAYERHHGFPVSHTLSVP